MTAARATPYIAYAAWGVYGFSRGWQAEPSHKTLQSTWVRDEKRSPLLTTERISNGFTNMFIYCIPLCNLIALKKTFDRIEISLTNKNPYDYPSSYRELFSYDYYAWP